MERDRRLAASVCGVDSGLEIAHGSVIARVLSASSYGKDYQHAASPVEDTHNTRVDC